MRSVIPGRLPCTDAVADLDLDYQATDQVVCVNQYKCRSLRSVNSITHETGAECLISPAFDVISAFIDGKMEISRITDRSKLIFTDV